MGNCMNSIQNSATKHDFDYCSCIFFLHSHAVVITHYTFLQTVNRTDDFTRDLSNAAMQAHAVIVPCPNSSSMVSGYTFAHVHLALMYY